MFAKNATIFLLVAGSLFIAMIIGTIKTRTTSLNEPASRHQQSVDNVPHIGRVQVLNGCGIDGAAREVEDFLRAHEFDVKNKADAESFNYPHTIIIARTTDMTIAKQIAQTLRTNKVVLLRNQDTTYDVSVVLGPDYGERIR